MSPEQARGEPIGPASDLFSTGVVLWELLAGERLFEGESEPEVLEKVRAARVPEIRSRNPAVPESLARVVAKALAALPADRHASAGEFLADLVRVTAGGECGRGDAEATAGWVRELFPDPSGSETAELEAYTRTQAPAGGQAWAPPGPPLVLGGAPQRAPRSRARLAAQVIAVAGVIAGGVALSGWLLAGAHKDPPGALIVRTTPEAAIWLDGKETGRRTPQLLEGLEAGSHRVLLRAPDFLDREDTVEVTAGKSGKLEVALVPDLRTLTVETVPPGATVSIPGRAPCTAPCSFEGLKPSETVMVAADLPGWRHTQMPVHVANASATLVKLASQTATALPTPAVVKASGIGHLSLGAVPWAYFSVDGAAESTKPLWEVPLEAGTHHVRVRRDDLKVSLDCTVEVEAGRTRVLPTIDLAKDPRCP